MHDAWIRTMRCARPFALMTVGLVAACSRPPDQAEVADERIEAVMPLAVQRAPSEPDSPDPAEAARRRAEVVAHARHLLEFLPAISAACTAKTGSGSAPRSLAVHRWTDASGITHYSDQAPPAAVSDHRVLEVRGLPPIEVRASGQDVNLPDHLQQRAVADALGVQRVLRDTLGVGAMSGLTLRVVFVKSAQTYALLIGDQALASSAGAYSTANKTIFVRMQGSDESVFTVLRHEITHALVHESIGNLPTPLNEGLAEYFGRYRVGGMGGQVDISANRAALIAAAPVVGTDALVDLLARDGREFYVSSGTGMGREQRYLQAYALVALLMQSVEGRASLSAVLVAEQADPCVPAAAEKILQQKYPGGLAALADAWTAFMRKPPDGIQAY